MRINASLRNLLIIAVVAAVVAFAPGGGTGGNIIVQAVSLIFLAAIAWAASIMYRQYRTELYSLGEGRRIALYVALGVAALTLTATGRLWSTSPGSVAWLVLMAGAVYTVFAVVWAARKY